MPAELTESQLMQIMPACANPATYRAAAQGIGLPLEEQPDLLVQPEPAALSAAWFWKAHGLNELADDQNGDNDTEDFKTITMRINVGTAGLSERMAFWEKAKKVLVW